MRWIEASEYLCDAVESRLAMTDDGRGAIETWCEARQVKLATAEGEKNLEILVERVREADDLATVVKRRRTDGLFDAHAARSYIEMLDSETPLCSPDKVEPQ